MPENKVEEPEVINEYTHFVGVAFSNTPRAYFCSPDCFNDNLIV